MSNDKTLATVKHGGCVQLGDGAEKPPQELPKLIVTRGDGIPLPDQAAAIEEFKRQCLRRVEAEYPHLSARPSPNDQHLLAAKGALLALGYKWNGFRWENTQPSPAGQGDELDLDRVLSLADVHAEESREDGVRLLDRGGLLAFAQDVASALASRLPEGQEPVMFINSAHLADVRIMPMVESMDEPNKMVPRNMAGINVRDEYHDMPLYAAPTAQAVDLGPVRAALQAAEALCVCCTSVDGYSRSELNAFGQNMRSQFTDALALIDGKAVGK